MDQSEARGAREPAEPEVWQSKVELMGQRAEVESWAWRLEEELKDPQAKAKLMTGKPQVDPCSRVEPQEEPRG